MNAVWWQEQWLILEPLLISTGLGMLFGVERHFNRKPAGFRTQVLVSLSMTTFVLMSHKAGLQSGAINYDPTRTIQGILASVGFIGGGSIILAKGRVQGLTTAAVVLMSAGVGAAVGYGWYALAVYATLLSLFMLILGRKIEYRLPEREDDEEVNGKKHR